MVIKTDVKNEHLRAFDERAAEIIQLTETIRDAARAIIVAAETSIKRVWMGGQCVSIYTRGHGFIALHAGLDGFPKGRVAMCTHLQSAWVQLDSPEGQMAVKEALRR